MRNHCLLGDLFRNQFRNQVKIATGETFGHAEADTHIHIKGKKKGVCKKNSSPPSLLPITLKLCLKTSKCDANTHYNANVQMTTNTELNDLGWMDGCLNYL